jgi:hypothetical protein
MPFFPLDERARWVYAVTDPMGSRFLTVTAEAPVEVEITDVVTRQRRRERAWVLRQSDRPTLMYAVQHENGIEMIERRMLEKDTPLVLVVTGDLRWSGERSWTLPVWHYALGTRRYRRDEDEEITVPAGSFRCVKILVEEGMQGTIWLAPGLGFVRTITEIEGLVDRYSVVQLHSFDLHGPGGEPS